MFARVSVALISLAALAACDPPVPDSGAGVGFGSYADYQAQREAELIQGGEGGSVTAALNSQAISPETTDDGAPADPAGLLGDEALAAVGAVPEAVTNDLGISAENDFSAVSSERSIEEDAARVAANREQYQVVEPTTLHARPTSGSAATLVQFALSTTNRVGEPIYSRLIPGAEARAARNCAKYPSPDKAQEDFLASGGPERNGKGLDPDGDGFACAWDPAPFRLAAGSR